MLQLKSAMFFSFFFSCSEPPKVQEMNGLQLLESSAHTLIYGEPKGHQEKSFFL